MAVSVNLSIPAQLLWDNFDQIHQQHGLPGALELPMESFARAVEIVLKEGHDLDRTGAPPDPGLWRAAVQSSGYTQSRQAITDELMPATSLA